MVIKNDKIATLSRAIIFFCGLGLLVILFTPIWRIDLMAPQYPEGLRLLIYSNKLAGNIDIINGLNHYIGMKTLHEDDFYEFKILPGIVIFFSLCFVASAFAGRRKWLNILFALFVAFGVLAIVDFWRWEYDYGHNLNPDAAIIVPGMSYQPPLVGYKKLLNFGAWSVPDIGGWIFLGTGIIILGTVTFEWRRRNKVNSTPSPYLFRLASLILLISSCSKSPEPIRIGKDHCDFCEMTISDNRFGAEIVTQKSKRHKFDDVHCILSFLNSNTIARKQIAGIYFTDFSSPHELINVEQAFFLQSPSLKSPMNGNIAAFSNEDSLDKILPQFYGNKITWENMQK